MPMRSAPLHSSAFAAADYDTDTQQLTVTFKNGMSYPLRGVPEDVYEAFINSPSPGSFWHNELQAYR